MTAEATPPPPQGAAALEIAGGRPRLWTEFLALFVGVPAALALFAPPSAVFTTLFAMTLVGVILLAATPGFRWRALLNAPRRGDALLTLGFVLLSLVIVGGLTLLLRPWAFLSMPERNPQLWIAIMLLYPILSVLPQELLYRPLFFERYGALFPGPGAALLANAAVFGLAHAVYANWVALTLTTAAGLAFGYAYQTRGSFALAVLWHALGGQIVFTLGLGFYFWHGAIPR